MRRRVAPAARARPVVPVGPTAGAASYSAVQLLRGPVQPAVPVASGYRDRGWRRFAEHVARCLSCGVADGVVHQVGPSGTARGSSELVKAHTPRKCRPSCHNTVPQPQQAGSRIARSIEDAVSVQFVLLSLSHPQNHHGYRQQDRLVRNLCSPGTPNLVPNPQAGPGAWSSAASLRMVHWQQCCSVCRGVLPACFPLLSMLLCGAARSAPISKPVSRYL